jgi:hypothetical protein
MSSFLNAGNVAGNTTVGILFEHPDTKAVHCE